MSAPSSILVIPTGAGGEAERAVEGPAVDFYNPGAGINQVPPLCRRIRSGSSRDDSVF